MSSWAVILLIFLIVCSLSLYFYILTKMNSSIDSDSSFNPSINSSINHITKLCTEVIYLQKENKKLEYQKQINACIIDDIRYVLNWSEDLESDLYEIFERWQIKL